MTECVICGPEYPAILQPNKNIVLYSLKHPTIIYAQMLQTFRTAKYWSLISTTSFKHYTCQSNRPFS